MKTLIIENTQETPYINLSKDNDAFEIQGNSLPEDVLTFYEPVVEWLNNYALEPKNETKINFKLNYYNTSSSKMFMKVFNILRNIYRSGNKVEVNWYYKEDDEDIIEAGEDYASTTRLPFKFVQY